MPTKNSYAKDDMKWSVYSTGIIMILNEHLTYCGCVIFLVGIAFSTTRQILITKNPAAAIQKVSKKRFYRY